MRAHINRSWAAAAAAWAATAIAAAQSLGADPLPSWTDCEAKTAIVAFVERVTDPGSPGFVPEAERIATFDNDGTLWAEQPIYFQMAFAIDRVKAMAPDHPEWKTTEPFASILKGDIAAAFAGGDKSIVEIVMATHAGLTSEAFDTEVREWIDTAHHPTTRMLYRDMVYQPQLELLAYLRDNGFKTFIVSGGGIEFMRVFADELYGVPPEQVVGSCGQTSFKIQNGRPEIMKLPKVDFIDDGAGKPVGIHRFIGRRPILAFGNSDGDIEMLQYTTMENPHPSVGLIVHHDDAAREWAYDRKSKVGHLDKGLDLAPKQGWFLVSMKDDWAVIYPPSSE